MSSGFVDTNVSRNKYLVIERSLSATAVDYRSRNGGEFTPSLYHAYFFPHGYMYLGNSVHRILKNLKEKAWDMPYSFRIVTVEACVPYWLGVRVIEKGVNQ